MRGLFRDFGGTFNYDASDPTASSMDITIDAASINMFHDGLNAHLKRDDFSASRPIRRFISSAPASSQQVMTNSPCKAT